MRLLATASVALVLVACSHKPTEPSPDEPTRLAIVPSPVNVQLNRTTQLRPVFLNFLGDTLRQFAVSWESTDALVASITPSGLLTGVRTGVASVTATSGRLRASVDVNVAGFSTMAMLSDDFTSYADTPALHANMGLGNLYTVAVNRALAQIDPVVLYKGHQTLRIDQPAGIQMLHLFPHFPVPTPNLWLRVKTRFSPGWRPSDLSTGGRDTFLHWGWGDGVGYRGAIDLVHDRRYRLAWFAEGASGIATADGGQVVGEWDDGGWYDYIVHYVATPEGASRTWFWLAQDGQTPILRATIDGFMNAGSAPHVERVQLSTEFHAPRAASQAVWVGQWEVVDGRDHPNPFGLDAGTE